MFTGYRNMTRGGYGENGILFRHWEDIPRYAVCFRVRVITGEHG